MPSDDEAEQLSERPVECVTGTHGDIVSHHGSQDNWSHQHGHQQHSTVNFLNIKLEGGAPASALNNCLCLLLIEDNMTYKCGYKPNQVKFMI